MTEVIHQPDTEEYFRGNIDIVLDRYHILKKGNDNLTNQLKDTQTKIQTTSYEHNKFMKEKQNSILQNNNTVLEYQKSLEEIHKQIQNDESKEEFIINQANEKIAEWGQVELAIKNIHVRALAVKKYKSRPKPDESHNDVCTDLINKLEDIKLRMFDLYKLTDSFEERD